MRIGGECFSAGDGPYVVGIVNLSPESTNKASVVEGAAGAVARARKLREAGARIIDVGAQSSHYAARMVSWRDERDRLVPAVTALKESGFIVSVDSWDARVVSAAVAAGADLVNDSDGFQSPAMITVVAEARLPVVIPFLTGPDPRAQTPLSVSDPVTAMLLWFDRTLERVMRAGLPDVVLDPGLGYAQRGVSQAERDALQRRMFSDLGRLRALGHPVLAPVFRKPERAFTLELLGMALAAGVDFLRTHDPALVFEAARG